MPGTMCMRRKAIRFPVRRMMARPMIMAATSITMTIIAMTSIAIMPIITAIPMLMTESKAPPGPRRRAPVRTGAIQQDAAQPTGHEGLRDSEAAALYRLLTWLSPSFPVGAFSYSSGLEWAVEAGDVIDAPSLLRWITVVVADGGISCDAALFANTHRAAADG